MRLKDYIKWHTDLGGEGVYQISPKLADTNTWGYQAMGNYELPDFCHLYQKGETEYYDGERMQYLGIYDDELTKWAKTQWPFLEHIIAKIQIQRPGERVRPHLDLCGQYFKDVVSKEPMWNMAKHSYEKPGIDVWRLVIAVDDHVSGQIFAFNNQEWKWNKGDCVRINAWRALHWTENKSDVDRPIIKVTGIKLGKPTF